MSKGLKIGITVVGGGADAVAAIWSYGIGQNVAYLAFAFQRLPEVASVALVSGPPGGGNVLSDVFGLPILQLDEAINHLDVIIELGSRALDAGQIDRLRKRGGKIVSYVAGNVMAVNFEALANNNLHGDMPPQNGFDAVWITPQNWKMCRGYSNVIHSDLVELAPHVWSPYSIQTNGIQTRCARYWRPRPQPGARIGVFEPNVTTTKTFHLPLLAVEEAYRAEPKLIESALLFNTMRLKSNQHMLEFLAATNLRRDNKVFVENRHPVGDVLGKHVDVVVCHQWESKLNYLFWDILYLGWPLVHNCEEFAHVGYYYPSFNPQAGGEALRDAIKHHSERRKAQQQAIADLLWTFSPDNPEVQDAHSRMLANVMDSKR